MERPDKDNPLVKKAAIQFETQLFETCYVWLQEHMPNHFFEEIIPSHLTLITHYLMGFPLQDCLCRIQLKGVYFVLILDSPEVDIEILKPYHFIGIKHYQTFISNAPPPFPGIAQRLRIGVIHCSSCPGLQEEKLALEEALPQVDVQMLLQEVNKVSSEIEEVELVQIIRDMGSLFLQSLSKERLALAIAMFLRTKTKDGCQYQVRYHREWSSSDEDTPSLQIVLAWRNIPKYRFLYRLAKMIYRHRLKMMRVNAAYIDPYGPHSTLVMSLGLHGVQGEAAWKAADLSDFLQELATLNLFPDGDAVEHRFVQPKLLSGNMGNLLRTIVHIVHQTLVHGDPNLYTLSNVEEALCQHPEITTQICDLFRYKFHPQERKLTHYETIEKKLASSVERLDTGNELHDQRRKNILRQAICFIKHVLKTTFYQANQSALGFRIDPFYLNTLPYDSVGVFPALPYGIFFIQGMHFIGFHIRFKDLARGGVRTILLPQGEQALSEKDRILLECYQLAHTQQKKNKDIPEGGAKGVIFVDPHDRLWSESRIYQKELALSGKPEEEVTNTLKRFAEQQKEQYLYQAQRAYIDSLLTLTNHEENGELKARGVVDYWNRPEYLYLGPDENLKDEMIEWIASYSVQQGYRPGIAFISSKPHLGINHREYGITSFGVNVCMEESLNYLNMDPKSTPFTVKMSGGPRGDVAGNQIVNLLRYYPNNAKLLALRDSSGALFDPNGLNLSALVQLFHSGESVASYPPQHLSEGGYLLDLRTKKEETTYTTKTLCWKKRKKDLVQTWLSGSETNLLSRHTVHQTKADIFIPAGGRPRTLNSVNYHEFLDAHQRPTSRVIVEGANLYLTPRARKRLEEKGVLIIKDSSANKGGVVCSSMEVLIGLILSPEEFLQRKSILVEEILALIGKVARDETRLMLHIHEHMGEGLTHISERISQKIDDYTYELLEYLESISLPDDPKDPLIQALFHSCPATLVKEYAHRILSHIPTLHKKAMIASHLASRMVYSRGPSWSPSIVDLLPLITTGPEVS